MNINACDALMGIFGFKRMEDNEMAEEKAAIYEFEGGLPRYKAEALARAEVETYREHRAKVDSDKVAK